MPIEMERGEEPLFRQPLMISVHHWGHLFDEDETVGPIEILVGVIYLFRWLGIGVTVSLFVVGAFLSGRSINRGNFAMAAAWAVLAVSPLLLMSASHVKAKHDFADRVAQVASFKRQPLGNNYPRTLEIRGFLDRGSISAFLDGGLFDQVIQIQAPSRNNESSRAELYTPVRIPICQSQAQQFLLQIYSNMPVEPKIGFPDQCSTLSDARLNAGEVADDAVVLMLGYNATLVQGRHNWNGGVVEVRDRQDGNSTLVDYQENPFAEEQKYPLTIETKAVEPKPPINPRAMILQALNWTPTR